ncbi:ABC transporter ATP-binding protein [Haloarchaeobius sp. TZWSO28]|uniref:ABC transporter ATP-binding protein n=1 Tax=Haloarchaeobius sp. TZWSO28 TaxID=3446119 RepID=UPI003EBAFEDD
MSAITVSGLTKDYGEVLANDDVSFSVAEGEVFGYLGPNGAGKTTTIRTLMGFIEPTAGTASLLGHDIRDEAALIEAKKRIGYLPANPSFDENATGREVLDLHASIKGDTRRAELLELFDPPLDQRIREYSTGNKQKLGLVQAFMHDPDLVIMDEPTSGLDPLMQQRFNEFVRQEKEAGTTIFLSSHVLSEVRRVCDRIGIIREGRIVTVETVSDLLDRSGKFVRLRVASDLAPADVTLDGVHDLSVRAVDGLVTEAPMANGGSAPESASELTFTYTGDFNSLVDFVGGYDVLELDVEEAPLEQVFMRFYGDDEVVV